MRYIAYGSAPFDPDKPESEQVQVDATGDLAEGGEVPIPTAGYISIEVTPGVWLTSRTSEWGEVSLGTRPMFLDAPMKPPPQQYLYECLYCDDDVVAERATHCKACSWLPMMRLVGPVPSPASTDQTNDG
jgi:hypothetical protein